MRLFPPVGWIGRLAAPPDRIGDTAFRPAPSSCSALGSSGMIYAFGRTRTASTPDIHCGRAAGTLHLFPVRGGRRVCLGNHFAMTEMVFALATLVRSGSYPRIREHRC